MTSTPERMTVMKREIDEQTAGPPRVGTPVEVRCTFDGKWARGFELAETTARGCRLRRVSDHYVLPGEFEDRDVRTVT